VKVPQCQCDRDPVEWTQYQDVVAKRHVSRCYYRRWADILDACETGCSTLLLSAAPAVVHSTSHDLTQYHNANPPPYHQSVAWITAFLFYTRSLPYTPAVYSRCWTPRRAWLKWDSITSTLL